jgi:hypothetical protein
VEDGALWQGGEINSEDMDVVGEEEHATAPPQTQIEVDRIVRWRMDECMEELRERERARAEAAELEDPPPIPPPRPNRDLRRRLNNMMLF